jgi:hypothetical protein
LWIYIIILFTRLGLQLMKGKDISVFFFLPLVDQ